MSMLIYNISWLAGVHDEQLPLRGNALRNMAVLQNAWVELEGGRIKDFGLMEGLNASPEDYKECFNASGRLVMPAWCDSHTHLVFAGSRESEFVDKIRGLSYAEIAARGGGILNSAARLKDTSEEELFEQSWSRLQAVIRMGTGAIEIKTGYGLDLEGELKMMRVIREIKKRSPIPVRATFLAAHALPRSYQRKQTEYVDEVIAATLPAIAEMGVAEYIDVFCEQGFFNTSETARICEAGAKFGLKPKIHANQLHVSGGVETGIAQRAISVDHLESMDGSAIDALAASSTIGTLLPTAAFFLRMPYQPARALIDAGAAVALATDFNPGSSPSGNMNLVVSLSCIQMKMLPEEAIQAAAFNGACAMEFQKELGSVAKGKLANLIVTRPIPSIAYFPYDFGNNSPDGVLINGTWFREPVKIDEA